MSYTNINTIGQVTEVSGKAIIIREDGSQETITLGTEVYQGDIIETTGDGAVNVGFIDDSSFAVSDNARVAMDEFVFDAESESGAQDFSVMQGVFVYTSGLIGRENPDSVEIDTPVGSIGIRGTIIGGHINPEGDSQITVIEGAIVVQNDAGESLLTNQFDTVILGGKDVAPSAVKTLDVTEVANDYGAVKGVSAELFSSFNDQMQQDGVSEGVNEEFNGEESPEGKENSEGEGEKTPQTMLEKHNLDKVADIDAEIAKLATLGKTMDDVTYTDDGVALDNDKLWGNRTQYRSFSQEYDPIAQISSDIEYQFSRPDGVDAVIPIGEAGAIITRINVDDKLGETFSVSDFEIQAADASLIGLLNIEQIAGHFYLKLADNVEFDYIAGFPPIFKLFVDSIPIKTFDDTLTQDIARVKLYDGEAGDFTDISVGFGNVDYVSSGTTESDHAIYYNNNGSYDIAVTPDSNDVEITGTSSIFGTSGDDHIEITHDVDFQLLNGGDGHDTLYLRGKTNSANYDFSSQASNIGGVSKDLSSIEQIIFDENETVDFLKLDITSITTLLKTSDLNFMSSATGEMETALVIATERVGGGLGNTIYFTDDNGDKQDLTHFDFDNKDTESVNFGDGEATYQIFEHNTLGVVAIETNINGASSGGIVV